MPMIAHAISPGLMGLIVENFLAKSFWRVLIWNGGSGSTGSSEVRFKTKGAAKAGTPLSSGGTPANAFDDDTETNWTITGEYGEYIGLEFSGEKDIDEVEIVSLFNDNANTLLDYEVQFSDDGAAWTTLWSSFGHVAPTSNGQVTASPRPLAATDGAAVVHQRVYAVLGAGAGGAMLNEQRAYAILGASPEASVNHIKVYAIYDAGS